MYAQVASVPPGSKGSSETGGRAEGRMLFRERGRRLARGRASYPAARITVFPVSIEYSYLEN